MFVCKCMCVYLWCMCLCVFPFRYNLQRIGLEKQHVIWLLLTILICISILFISTVHSVSVLATGDIPVNRAGKHFCLLGGHILSKKSQTLNNKHNKLVTYVVYWQVVRTMGKKNRVRAIASMIYGVSSPGLQF